MQTRPNLIPDYKIARLYAWAVLWLGRVVAWSVYWAALDVLPTRRELDGVARRMHRLVVISVVNQLARFQPTRNRHGRHKKWTLRIVAGARFRRLTRGKYWAHRIFAILVFIRDAKQHMARLLKRLRRGLTRLRVILPRAEGCALLACAPAAPCAADTS